MNCGNRNRQCYHANLEYVFAKNNARALEICSGTIERAGHSLHSSLLNPAATRREHIVMHVLLQWVKVNRVVKAGVFHVNGLRLRAFFKDTTRLM